MPTATEKDDPPSFEEWMEQGAEDLSMLMKDYNKNIVPFSIKQTLVHIEQECGHALDQKYRDELTRRTLATARTKGNDAAMRDLMAEALKFETDEDRKLLMDPNVSKERKLAALENKVKQAEEIPKKMESSFNVEKEVKNKAVA